MPGSPQWVFDRFRLDPDQACLWCEAQAVALPPKTFAVLHYLVTHPDRLVPKDELLDAVWPETAVSDAVVRVAIGALRKVLGDTVQTPRYIATVSRRGYRFLVPVTRVAPAEPTALPPSRPLSLAPASQPLLVEREAVLRCLHTAWAQVRQGRRQVVLVTGEAGMGKTSVVEAFTAQVRLDSSVWLAYGQCVEHYGAGEAYLPVLEALGQLCHAPEGSRLAALLRQQAPTWLVQLPWLLTETDRQQWRSELQGATRERMLREFAEVVETLTAATPLVLVLEDLHWSDYATLDLLALLARRQAPARLLVLGTYRSVEAIVQAHPLRTLAQELRQHGYSIEVPLALLSPAAVATYLAAHFPGYYFPAALALWLHAHTEGNPLFLVTLVQTLLEQDVLVIRDGHWVLEGELEAVEVGVPETLRQLIEHQLARVPPEAKRVLEIASVAGVAFATATVAAGLGDDVIAVEAHCEELAQRHLVRSVGLVTWPDGTVATRYEFIHALYQHVAYERLGPGHRVQLHQRLGVFLEVAYGRRAEEIAAELAEHFERAHDVQRAVHYLHQAAENAARRYAQSEAIRALMQVLKLLPLLPDARERAQRELAIQLALGYALGVTQGAGAADVERAYARARELGQQVGEASQLGLALLGLAWTSLVRGQPLTARELAAQGLEHFRALHDSLGLARAHAYLGSALIFLGTPQAGRGHLEESLALYQAQPSLRDADPEDLEVFCLARLAEALWALGYPDQALQRSQEALHLADALSSLSSLAMVLTFAARLHQYRREEHQASGRAEAALALAREQQFALRQAQAMVLHGWALVMQGQEETGMTQLHQGIAAVRATGAGMEQAYWLALLAEVYGHVRQPDMGLQALAEALALSHTMEQYRWEAELYRLQGALLLAQGDKGQREQEEAEACFQQALVTARRQQAKSLELRAAMSLARLWQQQGRRAEAHQLLAEVYGWFTEGFETADVQEAGALLEQLSWD